MKYNSILNTIGNTPLVKISKLTQDLNCNVYVKCEFFNPSGSIKDRIALRMVEKAEAEKKIRPGDTLIEPSSGNTGLGLALVGAIKNYKVIIVMTEKISQEKQKMIETLGATVIRTPSDVPTESPESNVNVAQKLANEMDRGFMLDQYSNQANPVAHFEGTAQEIWNDLNGHVDMLVVGAGTGGSLSGLSKALKCKNPNLQIVGVDPQGSIMSGLKNDKIKDYEVEGIGYDFLPKVFKKEDADCWYKSTDKESFYWARKLISKEGILCGGSSGATFAAAMTKAKSLKKDQNCVVIFADGARNYLTKFLNKSWLKAHDFTFS